MSVAYRVETDLFEGPLDLLLHLVNKLEIDLTDLPVSEITKQYMHYIHTMRELELNLASEYLVMAATLLQLKSRMLLPNPEMEESDEYVEEDDPREMLIERLIEYRKYKEAADSFKERADDRQQSYTKPPEKLALPEKKNDSVKQQGSIYDMLSAMQKVFDRQKWNKPMEKTIEKQDIPIKTRMTQLLETLNRHPEGVLFEALFPVPTKHHMVVTFMAMLELMKDKKIYCEQKSTFDALYLHKWRA